MAKWAFLAALLLPGLALAAFEPGEEMEYTASDGSKKTITPEEMAARMQEQQDFLKDATPTETGFTKETRGSGSIEEIEAENPGLALFLKKGEVAFKLLKKAGHVASDSTLAHLTSAALDAALEPPEERRRNEGFVREGIVLTVAGYDGDSEQRGKFEVVLERDIIALKSPGLHLLKAWKLDAEDARVEELYVEVLEEATSTEVFLHKHGSGLFSMLSIIVAISMVHLIRTLLEQYVFKKKDAEGDAAASAGAGAQAAPKDSSKGRKKSGRKRTKRD